MKLSTERVYYSEPWRTSLDARVLSCEESASGYAVVLDKTVIFPGGGGQCADAGQIAGSDVTAAEDAGDYICYTVGKRLAVGARVELTADIGLRREYCQQHTGEHIVSGIAHSRFGARNVGFHMSADYMTIDFDIPLSEDEQIELEDEANKAVFAAMPVISRIVTAEELERLELRKKSDGLTGELRVVVIEGVDSCTCCGTHTRTTAEVGMIRIVDSMKHRGGIRLWVLCGVRALLDYRRKQQALAGIARGFSTSWENAPRAVDELRRELSEQRRRYKQRVMRLNAYRADELIAAAKSYDGAKLVCAVEDDADSADLKLLAEEIAGRTKCVCALVGKKHDSVFYQIVISGGAKASARELCQVYNMLFSGKGGGNNERAQGSAKLTAAFGQAVEQVFDYMARAMSKS
ncbi:MAG: alanyl-tRNA editing protein [Clostridia bacterium]|nr:alanyl-tRNA editing protein [Clostridia bacterium]